MRKTDNSTLKIDVLVDYDPGGKRSQDGPKRQWIHSVNNGMAEVGVGIEDVNDSRKWRSTRHQADQRLIKKKKTCSFTSGEFMHLY